jgi:hypothetical protein
MSGRARIEARVVMDGQVSEAAFQAAVLEFAIHRGWRAQHNYDSRRSGPHAGFPDLMLVRVEPGSLRTRCVVAELKRQRGRVDREQVVWLGLLQRVEGLEVYVWRPADWPGIEEILR